MYRQLLALVVLVSCSLYSSAIIRMVTNLNDSGEGSLREAIAMTANGDTIQFEVTGTIVLSTGCLDIYTDILIDGPGMDDLIINPLGNSSGINVDDGSVHIRGLTVEQADPYGIIVGNSEGNFTLQDVRIQECYNESSRSSALYVATSQVTEIMNCEFLNNDVDGDGITYVYGGGAYVYASQMAVVEGCTFEGNTISSINGGGTGSQSHAYGGGIYINSSDAYVSNSSFTGNSCTAAGCCGSSPNWARAKGGGIYFNNGTIHVDGVQAQSNSLSTNDYVNYELKQGMGCYITNCDSAFVRNSNFRSHSAGFNGQYVNVYGGALYAIIDSYVEIDNVTTSSNSGQSVGGVALEAVNGMTNHAVVNELRCDSNSVSNSTPEKAGLFLQRFDSATISNSRFIGNSYRGIAVEDVDEVEIIGNYFGENQEHLHFEVPSGLSHLVENNTFSNSVSYGINFNMTNGTTLANNTFVDNNGDVYLNNSSVTMKNNLMSYTTFVNDSYNDTGTSLVISQGGNVCKDDSWLSFLDEPTDIHNSDAQLMPAADNGGPTWTCAIPSNSSAVDRELDGLLAVDQRGFVRDGNVDAGAYEFGASDPLSIVFETISEDIEACDGDGILIFASFISGSELTYQWYKDDIEIEGETETSLTFDPVSTADNGNYKCVAMNELNSSESTTVSVTVNELPEVSYSGETQVCEGLTTTLMAMGAVDYAWDNDLGSDPQVDVLVTADMAIQLTGTDENGCSNSVNIELEALPNPEVQMSEDSQICQGTEATISASGGESYEWNHELGGGEEHQVSPEETTIYTVVVTGSNGCEAEGSVTVEILPEPEFMLTDDLETCPGDSILLEADAEGLFFLWADFGGGPAFWTTPQTDHTYYVYATDDNNCGATDSVVVTLLELPAIDAGVDVLVCLRDSAMLMATGSDNYLWDNGLGEGNEFLVNPDETTTYTVSTVGQNGCEASDEIEVVVAPLPEVGAGDDQSLCSGEEAILEGSGAVSYEWDNGVEDGVGFIPDETMTYTVIGTDENGCEGTDMVEVEILDSPEPMIFENGLELSTTLFESYQWYWNGIEIDGATNQIYNVDANGSYTVVVTDVNGCEGESDAWIVTDVSVDETETSVFTIFPNPVNSSGELTIVLDDFRAGESNLVRLWDSKGRLVMTRTMNAPQVSISIEGLVAGVYAVAINKHRELLLITDN